MTVAEPRRPADDVVDDTTPAASDGARPPHHQPSPGEWGRVNLARTWRDALVSAVIGGVALYVVYRFGRFVLVTGRWEIVERNLTSFVVGRFDREQLWRPATSLALAAAVAGVLAGLLAPDRPRPAADVLRRALARLWPLLVLAGVLLRLAGTAGPLLLVGLDVVLAGAGYLVGRRLHGTARRWAFVGVAASPVVLISVISGFGGVPWDRWGGLLLNLLLAVCGIGFCFPLGVALALGRRSTLPVIRWLSVAYIELFRGVPLVALILMGVLTLQFFVPPELAPDPLVRVIAVFTLFTAAYVAEIVRGGLQSVPRGQAEAATALGLRPVKVTALVVLPQALRASIPALVGQFISLFKDTSLVFVVGITELLRVAEIITAQTDFRGQGLQTETLVFAAFVFWVGAYTMSRESQRLERRLGVGER